MSTIKKAVFAPAVVIMFAYCGSSRAPEAGEDTLAVIEGPILQKEPPTADGNGAAPLSSSAARHDAGDTTHRFIRTADVRFRVNDVVRATYAIEAIVRAHHGYVEHTSLRGREERKELVRVSRDSLLERSWMSVHNDLRIRVPNHQLDSTLIAIAPLVDFLDHRNIDADNVHLQLLAGDLEQRRIAHHRQRVANAVDEQGRKLKETVPVEERLLERQEQSDAAMLSNLGLEERIAYSTLTIDLYQRETLHSTLLAAPPPVATFSEPAGLRVAASLAQGWSALLALMLVLLKIWPLWILGGLVLLVMRRMRPSMR